MGMENFKDTKIYQVSKKRADLIMHVNDQDAAWNANRTFQAQDNLAHFTGWRGKVWWENGVAHPHVKKPR